MSTTPHRDRLSTNLLALAIVLAATVTALAVGWLDPADAHTERATSHNGVRVTGAEERVIDGAERLAVTFSDGESRRWLHQCATDEADTVHRCYWNAREQGNGKGTSFVKVRGHLYRLPQRFLDAPTPCR